MKITLPDGTTLEGTKDEIGPWLPPRPNWDGSWPLTCGPFPDNGSVRKLATKDVQVAFSSNTSQRVANSATGQ